jgi:serine/threonine protein kinase
MSKSVEKLLRRMLVPNADLRYTAAEAVEDPYWAQDLSDIKQETGLASHSKYLANRRHLPPWRLNDRSQRKLGASRV